MKPSFYTAAQPCQRCNANSWAILERIAVMDPLLPVNRASAVIACVRCGVRLTAKLGGLTPIGATATDATESRR